MTVDCLWGIMLMRFLSINLWKKWNASKYLCNFKTQQSLLWGTQWRVRCTGNMTYTIFYYTVSRFADRESCKLSVKWMSTSTMSSSPTATNDALVNEWLERERVTRFYASDRMWWWHYCLQRRWLGRLVVSLAGNFSAWPAV